MSEVQPQPGDKSELGEDMILAAARAIRDSYEDGLCVSTQPIYAVGDWVDEARASVAAALHELLHEAEARGAIVVSVATLASLASEMERGSVE